MRYILPLTAVLLVGAGCNRTLVTPVVTAPPAAPTSTPEVTVQNFGNVSYVPEVVVNPVIPNPESELDWQGWWKVGEEAPGRPVYVLIEGTDYYFYSANTDRSKEVRGHWKFEPGGELIIQESKRVSTVFKRWVHIDDDTSYVLRGHTWERWEKITDPMLP